MKSLSTITQALIGVGLVAGVVAESAALPSFTIDPSAIPGAVFATTPFNATAISISGSSELITLAPIAGSPFGTGVGSGWARFGTFNDDPAGNTLVSPLASGLLVDYGLYLTFDIAVTLTSGSLGLPGSDYKVTLLDFLVWVDPGLDTTFTSADTAPVTAATVGGITADDRILAVGSLVNGSAALNANGGAGITTTNLFAVCTGAGTADLGGIAVPPGGTPFMNGAAAGCVDGMGDSFFQSPNPFYPLVFDTLNNTTQGVSLDVTGTKLAVNAAGRADFKEIPEPGTMALLGLSLLGVGVSARRRNAA